MTAGKIVRDISGETVCGFRVAAYRETHPEHGDQYGHSYSEHWSTPSKDPRVKVERLFTEDQLREQAATITSLTAEVERLRERLRVLMLQQPVTGERQTYSDGFAQGLSEAIHGIDKTLAAIQPTDTE